MKFLNASGLSKLVFVEITGKNYNWYSFMKIKNAPSIRTSKSGVVRNCTCKFHSLHDVEKKNCRYINALKMIKKVIK